MNLREKKVRCALIGSIIDLAAYKNPEELLVAKMAKLKAVKTGREKILDMDGEIWEYESQCKKFKLWAWNGVFLKHISLKVTMGAIEINLQPELNENLFVPLSDVTLVYPN